MSRSFSGEMVQRCRASAGGPKPVLPWMYLWSKDDKSARELPCNGQRYIAIGARRFGIQKHAASASVAQRVRALTIGPPPRLAE